jgi:outer membrane protein OmpA-like peptidoglycan-associated protein
MKWFFILFCALLPVLAEAQTAAPDFESERASLQVQLDALDAEAAGPQWADLERLQARQALQAAANAKPRERTEALALARISIAIADAEIRSEQLRLQSQALDRERDGIVLEASRRDAELARKEAEQLRLQALAREEEQAMAAVQAQAQAVEADNTEAGVLLSETQIKEAELARLEEEIEAQVKQRGDVLSVHSKSGKSVYTLSASAFVPGKTGLNPEARQSLQQLAKRLKASGKSWRIEGYTDAVGDDANNREFSRLRAEAVLNALRAGGVPGSRLSAVGLGAKKPVSRNDTKAGRAQNRRIEIIEK